MHLYKKTLAHINKKFKQVTFDKNTNSINIIHKQTIIKKTMHKIISFTEEIFGIKIVSKNKYSLTGIPLFDIFFEYLENNNYQKTIKKLNKELLKNTSAKDLFLHCRIRISFLVGKYTEALNDFNSYLILYPDQATFDMDIDIKTLKYLSNKIPKKEYLNYLEKELISASQSHKKSTAEFIAFLILNTTADNLELFNYYYNNCFETLKIFLKEQGISISFFTKQEIQNIFSHQKTGLIINSDDLLHHDRRKLIKSFSQILDEFFIAVCQQ
jgi:hypothetical protein